MNELNILPGQSSVCIYMYVYACMYTH